jgi:hypothetical protein
MRARRSALPLLILLALGGTAAGDIAIPAAPYLNGYDVALAALDGQQVIVQRDGRAKAYDQAYLVRLHGYFPTTRREPALIFFGSERLGEYRTFGRSAYFLIYERSRLDSLAGREIGFRWGEGSRTESFGVKFEPARFDLQTPVPFQQALERPMMKPRLP